MLGATPAHMDTAGDASLPGQPHPASPTPTADLLSRAPPTGGSQMHAAEPSLGPALAEGHTRAQPGAAGHAASPNAVQPNPNGHAGAAAAAQAWLGDPALRMPMARLEAETAAVRRFVPASSSGSHHAVFVSNFNSIFSVHNLVYR